MNKSHKPKISFGTDGWRAVIAEEFTFENVRRVSRAVSVFLNNKLQRAPQVAVGYDTRFASKAFAEACAEVLSSTGCSVAIAERFVSTPALSAATVALKADLGIMISGSHNPCNYNGFKIKSPEGCSAPKTVTNEIERLIEAEAMPEGRAGKIIKTDITGLYLKALKPAVDINLIKKSHLNLAIDPMYGAASGYMEKLLSGGKCRLVNIHSSSDPLFGGLHPEPIDSNLSELKSAVKRNGADAGLATDGDGDRIGVVDEKGRYLTPHQVFPLLLYYLVKYKKLRGKVVQAISLGYVSERIARDFGLPFEEVPIGFKYIAEKIMTEDILIGGEESGGYGFGNFLPERDGVLNSLVIAEILASTGKSLSNLLSEIEKKYGSSAYLRTDFRNPGIEKNAFVSVFKEKAPSKIAGLKVKQIKDYDGIEFILEDDSWLLLRPSGTEPVIRVYCESDNMQKTRKIISWGQNAVSKLI